MTEIKHLVDEFAPELYKLRLQLDSDNLVFSGQVEIEGNIINDCQQLTLHAKDLNVWQAYIDGELTENISFNSATDELTIKFEQTVSAGKHKIGLVFDGKISTTMNGIYPCDFVHDGQNKRIIATQFESHHARQAFPCIDEPASKAVYELTLVTSQGQTVIANTEVEEQTTEAGLTTTKFAATPKMSSYLLAFVCGEMASRKQISKSGVTVSTYTTPANINFSEFALETACRAIDFYQEYFDIPFPLTKCDFVALPEFEAGAMENWGCITFRESAMLVDIKNTSVRSKQFVAQVIAHELAHQWFGNLVTLSWWSDLWLNEGFATWMEYFVTDKLFPDWQMWTQFITDEFIPAQKLDSLQSTHPIEVEVKDPSDIPSIFDSISYSKGASLIRMAHNLLGDKVFRDGINAYLEKFQYGNATTDDLWASLGEVSYQNVAEFMTNWSKQPGYPLVTIEHQDSSIKVTQKRFGMIPQASQQTWSIPLYSNSQLSPNIISQSTTNIGLNSTWDSLVINEGLVGFYRTFYPKDKFETFSQDTIDKRLLPIDRLGFIDDSFELAKSNYIPTSTVLELASKLQYENDAAVWNVLASNLLLIPQLFSSFITPEDFQFYASYVSREQIARLGWQPNTVESYFDKLLRPTILSLATYGGDKIVLRDALQLVDKIKQIDALPPDIRTAVYKASIWYGDSNAFNALIELYKQTDFADQLMTITGALTQTRNPEQVKACLALLSDGTVRQQDLLHWLALLFRNPYAKVLTWQWVTTNWQWLAKQFEGTHALAKLPLYSATQIGEPFKQAFLDFYQSTGTTGLEMSINQGLEQISWQNSWVERNSSSLAKFFADFKRKNS